MSVLSASSKGNTLLLCILTACALSGAYAQQPPAPRAVETPKAGAPVDLTGYWVSLITEDWRWRMLTPPKGDFASVPLNGEGRKVANDWDTAKDVAGGDICKAYGAAAIMRVPTRLHITWEDDHTLKVEADAGQQTRMFYFGESAAKGGDWQGISHAEWETFGGVRGERLRGGLKVVTTKMKPGYLRKNGVPYSANAALTEYFDRVNETWGDSYLIVRSMVDDPTYLLQPFITSSHFKREPDASKWAPTSCSAQ